VKQGGRRLNWREIYHCFAKEYGWGPGVVNDLTNYQIRMYLAEMKDLAIEPEPPAHMPLHRRVWFKKMGNVLEHLKQMLIRAVLGK
jgi:hypothetical protein